MVDVGGRNVDRLKEFGYKIEAVSGSVKKLIIFCNLESWYGLSAGE